MTMFLIAFFLVAAVVVGLPVIAYLIMKFGAAGYFRAKQRQQEKDTKQL